MIVLHASFPVVPDRREEALEMIAELVEQSQNEDGTIEYRATTDLDDPNVVRFFERYEDEEALEAHTRSEHFQEFAAALPDLLAGEPEAIRFDVEEASELDL